MSNTTTNSLFETLAEITKPSNVVYYHKIAQSDLNDAINLLRTVTPFPEKLILKLMDSETIKTINNGK